MEVQNLEVGSIGSFRNHRQYLEVHDLEVQVLEAYAEFGSLPHYRLPSG